MAAEVDLETALADADVAEQLQGEEPFGTGAEKATGQPGPSGTGGSPATCPWPRPI